MKRAVTVLVIIAAIGAGAGAYYIRRGAPDVQVQTSPISRGDIIDTVGATGTLQAVTTVQVGSQVSGNIAWLGADFNSIVRKGQVIAAPIDGIVTQRNVDVGQTVAASMQAPTLFIIAADLTKMQVNANIDEADVGRIRPAQHVTFRVDAYPTETFEGNVSQIRLQPVVVQNVTTYGTVIDVPNAQLKLKPGMTANVKIEIAKRSDALRIPNAALRFRPTTDLFAALNQPVPPEVQGGGRGGRGAFGNRAGGNATSAQPSSPVAVPQGSSGAQEAPRADGGGRRGFDPARMERFKSMSPDEQKQFIARMKERGQDTSAFEKLAAHDSQSSKGSQPSAASALRQKYGAPANGQTAQTIDALFPPLPTVESRGRAWLFMDHQLKPVNLRLGVTDGTYTELISTELQPGMEVVTGVTGLGATRSTGGQQGTGNPLMPQRGGPPGGGGFRGGR